MGPLVQLEYNAPLLEMRLDERDEVHESEVIAFKSTCICKEKKLTIITRKTVRHKACVTPFFFSFAPQTRTLAVLHDLI
jgi:hypothetical protein